MGTRYSRVRIRNKTYEVFRVKLTKNDNDSLEVVLNQNIYENACIMLDSVPHGKYTFNVTKPSGNNNNNNY